VFPASTLKLSKVKLQHYFCCNYKIDFTLKDIAFTLCILGW